MRREQTITTEHWD